MITEEQTRGPTVLATRVIHNLGAEDQGSGFPGSMALRHGGICAKIYRTVYHHTLPCMLLLCNRGFLLYSIPPLGVKEVCVRGLHLWS